MTFGLEQLRTLLGSKADIAIFLLTGPATYYADTAHDILPNLEAEPAALLVAATAIGIKKAWEAIEESAQTTSFGRRFFGRRDRMQNQCDSLIEILSGTELDHIALRLKLAKSQWQAGDMESGEFASLIYRSSREAEVYLDNSRIYPSDAELEY